MADDYYAKLAQIESANNPYAKAGTSSATGLYQMTQGTFKNLQKEAPWLKYADWNSHAQDPAIQQQFAKALTNQNDVALKNRGRDVNDLNRYLYHFAGSGTGDRLINADPNALAGDILGPQAAKANPRIANMTVGQMKDFFNKKMGNSAPVKQAAATPWQAYQVAHLAAGGTPWEAYAQAEQKIPQASPTDAPVAPLDTANDAPPVLAPTSKKKGVWEAMKEGFGQALPAAAKALNTRPEQIIGKDKNGMPIFREQTPEEKALPPTNAARRAGRTAGFLQGMADLPVAVAQFAPGKVGEAANAQLEGYENFRKDLGIGDDTDIARFAGNVANPLSIKGLGALDKLAVKSGAGLFKRGVIGGTAAGATQPVAPSEENFWGEKALQTGLGAVTGGTLNKLFGAAPKMNVPQGKTSFTSAELANMSPKEKVVAYQQMFPDADLTWGQLLGKGANETEQKLTGVPGLGSIIKEARNKTLNSQNLSMMNTALKDAGLSLEKGTKAGRSMFEQAYDKLTGAYDNLLEHAHLSNPSELRAKIYGKMETGTGKSVATADQLADSYQPGVISNDYNRLSEGGQQKFDRIMDNFFSKFGKDPKGNHSLPMNGNQFKGHEEDFKEVINDYMSSGGEDRMIGRMLKKSLGEIYDSLGSNTPEIAAKLKNLNKSYAKYKTLENASTASSTSEGIFTPAQSLRAATKGSKGQIAKGKGLLQSESQLSQDVLGNAYPDSGTAGRLNAASLLAQVKGLPVSVAASLLYSPGLARVLTGNTTKVGRAFEGTRTGAALAKNAPWAVPGAVRGMTPSGSDADIPEQADGGAVGPLSHPFSSFTKGPLSMVHG